MWFTIRDFVTTKNRPLGIVRYFERLQWNYRTLFDGWYCKIRTWVPRIFALNSTLNWVSSTWFDNNYYTFLFYLRNFIFFTLHLCLSWERTLYLSNIRPFQVKSSKEIKILRVTLYFNKMICSRSFSIFSHWK